MYKISFFQNLAVESFEFVVWEPFAPGALTSGECPERGAVRQHWANTAGQEAATEAAHHALLLNDVREARHNALRTGDTGLDLRLGHFCRPHTPPRCSGAHASFEEWTECRTVERVGHLPPSNVDETKERRHQSHRPQQRYRIASVQLWESKQWFASLFAHFKRFQWRFNCRATKSIVWKPIKTLIFFFLSSF